MCSATSRLSRNEERMRSVPNKKKNVEQLLLEAVHILARLACRRQGQRLSNSEVITMQQLLFTVLEELNDLQEKNAEGGSNARS